MKVQEAAEALARLLQTIDDEEITVITENEETIFLTRGSGRGDGFAEVNNYTGKWRVAA